MAWQQVVIALGTNVGDRGRNAWWAVQQLMQHGIQVLRCSGLYETKAAYVTDQPAFLNAAVLASTRLPPRDLLSELKSIEAAAGRDVQGGQRWGPRPLDLDIIFMTGQPYEDEKVHIPHPRWHERDFVIRPVSDLWYTGHDSLTGPAAAASQQQEASTSTPPTLDPSLRKHVQRAHDLACAGSGAISPSRAGHEPEGSSSLVGGVMRRVTPAGKAGRLITWGERTLVMGILNVTPDSFSDGGTLMAKPQHPLEVVAAPAGTEHSSAAGEVDVGVVVRAARQMAADGADILDVGGQSTRPGAVRLSPEQELARVMPTIRALRSCQELDDVLLSVDTFHAEVACQAVHAGADIVNDVSGGALDPSMRQQVAQLGVPFVLMHMRGDPSTMNQPEHTSYDDVAVDVGRELQAAADAAVAAGIPAWNIITDPGIGFAKTSKGNVALMRGLRDPLRETVLQGAFRHGPMLVGPSRKGFLGKLTGNRPAKERDAATVAAAVACVERGADIVRAHNVRDVLDGVRVADAVYR